MRPKPPPHYRILVMMATNMPSALDEALLRPGRIDRIYRVGYPSKAGRIRTYEGYFAKVPHELTAEQIDKLATITPYATGATHQGPGQRVADHRDQGRPRRHHLSGRDQGQAAQGTRPARGRRVHRAGAARGRDPRGVPRGGRLPDAAAHGDRHRHDREGQRLPRHGVVDQAGGPVHPVAQRVRVRHPRRARLAGRGADVLRQRQLVRRLRRPGLRRPPSPPSWRGTGAWARPCPRPPRPAASRRARRAAATGPPRRPGRRRRRTGRRRSAGSPTGSRTTWAVLLDQAEEILRENERHVLALAHALETYKTLSGEDVTAIFEGGSGPLVDGAPYADDEFIARLRDVPRGRPARAPRPQRAAASAAVAERDARGTGERLAPRGRLRQPGQRDAERQRRPAPSDADRLRARLGTGTSRRRTGQLGRVRPTTRRLTSGRPARRHP